MRLLHYSDNPVLTVRSVSQADPERSRFDKPKGFWISVEGEDDWASWCRNENFRDVDAQVVTEVFLTRDANVLLLKTAEDLDEITREYGNSPIPELPDFVSIDWERLAEEYQGIIIAPYIWERRLDGIAKWYYGWDCASGCIWDAAAVTLTGGSNDRIS